MSRPGALVALILAVGIAGTVLALKSREDNAALVAQQRALAPVAADQLERLLLTTSDPRPGHGGHALDSSCRSASSEGLGDPWTCLVSYPRPPRVRYQVTVYADRSIYGSGLPEGARAGTPLIVKGCCVNP